MDLVKVEIVGLEASQGSFYLAHDGLARKETFVEIDLRGQHHILAFYPKMLDGRSKILFTCAV